MIIPVLITQLATPPTEPPKKGLPVCLAQTRETVGWPTPLIGPPRGLGTDTLVTLLGDTIAWPRERRADQEPSLGRCSFAQSSLSHTSWSFWFE